MAAARPDDTDIEFAVHINPEPNADTQDMGIPGVLSLRVTAVDAQGREMSVRREVRLDPAQLAADLRNEMAAGAPAARQAGAALFGRQVLAAYHRTVESAHRRGMRLRLALIITDERLASVPWELASAPEWRDGSVGPHQFLVLHQGVSVVRRSERSADPRAAHPQDLRGTLVVCGALTVAGVLRHSDGTVEEIASLRPGSAMETSTDARLLSELGGRDVLVLSDPATPDRLRRALRGPVWGLCFAGHGRRDGIVLAAEDGSGPQFMPGSELAALLVEAGVAVVVLAACDTATPTAAPSPDSGTTARDDGPPHEGGTPPRSPYLAEQLVQAGVPWVIGMNGPIGDRPALALTRRFFETLAWGGSVDRAVAQARQSMAQAWWQPVVHTCRNASAHLTLPPSAAQPPETLRACHVEPDRRAARHRALPGSGRPARIDMLWCLDRGPLRGVLVDVEENPEDTPSRLADQLNDVETGPLRLQTTFGGPIPRRNWFAVSTQWLEPRRDPAGFAKALVQPEHLHLALEEDPGGGGIGLVLPFLPGRDQPQDAVSYARAVADCFPGAALLVHVRSPRAPRALDAAAEIRDGLPGVRPDGSDLGVSVLMRAGTPLLGRSMPSRPPVAPASSPLQAAAALAPGLARPPAGGDQEQRDAIQLIEAWGAADDERRSVTERWAAELAALLALSDKDEVSPAFLRAILLEHARSRPDPVRSASLLLVSGCDSDTRTWLDAAEAAARPVIPQALPPADWTPVLIAELGRADTPGRVRAVARRWAGLIPGDLRPVVEHLETSGRERLGPSQRDELDRSFLEGLRDPAVAEAALRCGVGTGLGVTDLGTGDPPAVGWALLTRRPLDAASAQRLLTWSDALRRVLGYISDSFESDAEVRRGVAEFHRMLRPWHPPPTVWPTQALRS
ncbi:CHAT domain-containing protein [Streptomyces cyaneofuscatus]